MKRRYAIGFLLWMSAACSAGAQTLFYDASLPRTPPGNPSLSYYYSVGGAGNIFFDDVTVPSPFSGTQFHVTQLTFKISQKAGAPAVNVTPYYSILADDYADGPNNDPYNPTALNTWVQSVPANPSASTLEQIYTIGDGIHTLFNVDSSKASPDQLYKSFGFGLRFSNSDTRNGWTVATQQAPNETNLDVLWDYNDSNPQNISITEFTYDQDSSGLIYGTQYLQVSGLVLSGLPGDANTDGVVDILDLQRLASHWMQNGNSINYTLGDFNFDQAVNQVDLGILAENWQGTAALGQALTSMGLPANVPEPTALLLLPAGMLAMLRRRH